MKPFKSLLGCRSCRRNAIVPTGANMGTVSVVTSSATLSSSPQFVVTK